MSRLIEPRSPMSAGEVARILGVNVKSVTRWAKAGKLPFFWTPGGERRYWPSDVEKYLEPGNPDDRWGKNGGVQDDWRCVMTTIAERVAKGAALLDEREPGWWQRIDLDKLDLESSCRCVLGQLATDLQGPWRETAAHFGLDSSKDEDAKFGFNTWDTQTSRQYASLTAAWRRLIKARRAES